MKRSNHKAIAIVGVGAIMPDAKSLPAFWNNIKNGRYSISDVPKDRWDPDLYYDPDPKAPDKTYSRIGGWVREWDWDPLSWRLPIPPKVSDQMDLTQIWAISASREALYDFGYPEKQFDPERTAVILGNAMGGDQHLRTAARILFPEYERMLETAGSFATMPEKLRREVMGEVKAQLDNTFLPITEDTMPGELSNIVAGRIAALYNFRGPNYVADAACASAMAAMTAAIEGLEQHDYDLVVSGGVDANMGPAAFVKFCKIGALSATGTRPYAKGADGFVMGEGAAIFILKRLEDAERDQDKIYAVIRGFGGSSDGKGKGITAPNPAGQKIAVKRGWENAGLSPATASLVEGHGTSTSVGDAVELQCLHEVFGDYVKKPGSIALGSVKSNIGHLKGGAGAAGLMKATMSLYEKVLPPSLNFNEPNPNIDFNTSPFFVNTQLRPWELNGHDIRRCGVSAFGFGGTNFHAVLEEYIPGRIRDEQRTQVAVQMQDETPSEQGTAAKKPLRGAFVRGGSSLDNLVEILEAELPKIQGGYCPDLDLPDEKDLKAPHRLAVDYSNAEELASKLERALKALKSDKPGGWRVLNAKGIFYGKGKPGKVAFLFTGQGSQYVNMLDELRKVEPIVAETVAQADKVMKPLLGKPITEFIYVDGADAAKVEEAEEQLKQTEITQPAVLTVDTSLSRLMQAYGIQPDMVMGHSLGEYGALVCADVLSFDQALEAVSARGHQMAKVQVDDKGKMAAIFGSYEKIAELLEKIEGYVEIANINSNGQSVIGGATQPVLDAMELCKEAGFHVAELPVSHAFHTRIVAPASEPLKVVLAGLNVRSPRIPVIANISGDFYPMGPDVKSEIVDILSKQVASPVQFVKGVKKLYDEGVRAFIEMGPKKALNGFVKDILSDEEDVFNLFTNMPKVGDMEAFNQALCGMYAAGHGAAKTVVKAVPTPTPPPVQSTPVPVATKNYQAERPAQTVAYTPPSTAGGDKYEKLGRLFVDFMDRARDAFYSDAAPVRTREVWVTGAALGLPGVDGVFQDSNVARILNGDQFIRPISDKLQRAMVDKNITRLVKTGKGGPRFETIDRTKDVIKLAGQKLNLDLVRDFDFPEERTHALDVVTMLAIGAGIDAMRDAGIPLSMSYKTTSTGSKLPDRWLLPEAMRDDTGIIFASAFPGYNAYASEIRRYHEDQSRKKQIELLSDIRKKLVSAGDASGLVKQVDTQIAALEKERAENPYIFDRRFLFRVLGMGHSQFAEYIGARGPNIHMNAACASGTMAMGLAKTWIEAGKCRRVIILSADDITSEETLDWFASGFLASGAAATDERIEDAALPFDRRRHGMIVGMGSAAVVVESGDSARERGLSPICEVLSAVSANSAFHGTRLDVEHIKGVMEELIQQAEKDWGIDRHEIAGKTVFISHETYTPARGGSASAEIHALRHVFANSADKIVIANTKGYTGHAMATGIEDVLGVKSIETGIVPPVANFKEVDPELGMINLSKGGAYPVTYALRLAAGFGSQISMSLMRWVPTPDGRHRKPEELGYQYRITDPEKWNNWLRSISDKTAPALEVYMRNLRIAEPGLAPSFHSPNGKENGFLVVEEEPAPSAPEIPPVVVEQPVPVAENAVQTAIMELIAEKTGYPPDMLDIDLDLEADLGIDTVKQAELFADIREQYGIERDDSIILSDFPTLRHIIQFVYDKKPELKEQILAPAKAPAATPAQVVADVPAPSANGVQETILQLIAEKTGYPADMLDPDLDLEADLGIDTVKQAELFADVREAYGIERDDSIQLADFPTLRHIVGFVLDKRPDLVTAPVAAPPKVAVSAAVSAPQPAVVVQSSGVVDAILDLIAEKTGYPKDMLDPDLDLEADLGIDTVKQAELFADVRSAYGIERDDTIQLADFPTLKHIVQFVYDRRPDLAVAPPPPVAAKVEPKAPTPAPAPVQKEEKTGNTNEVLERILDLIAEKTGYPKDMLDPELDLEADLGIDTVKQAELFAEIRESYDIPRDDSIQLSEFPTLNHIVGFVLERRPDLAKKVAVEAPKPAPKPVEAAPAVAPAGGSTDEVLERILDLIAEKTGYPKDMLDPDLDLEADLGIDTVKQAELFAEIRESYDIPRDDSVDLSEFPTLNHIVRFVLERRPEKGGTEITASVNETDQAPASISIPEGTIVGSEEAALKVPRRVPVAQLRPALELCKTTGAEIREGGFYLLMADDGGIGKALEKELKKRKARVQILDPVAERDELEKQLQGWIAEQAIDGVFWFPSLDTVPAVSELNFGEWKALTHRHVKLLHATMRTIIRTQDTAPFLLSATRLGGRFGYDEKGALSPLGGAVCGFTKSYKREHPEVLSKVVDFAESRKTAALMQTLLDELAFDPGIVEIGYFDDQRWTIGLEEQPWPQEEGVKMNADTVFLVTGAAGSIVSAILSDLTRKAGGGVFHLLDLAEKPDPADADLNLFRTDKEGLKRALFTRLSADGKKVTPVMIEKALAGLERKDAALRAIETIERTGGKVYYHSVNLLRDEDMAKVMGQIRKTSDRIDVLLHAGGLEISQLLPNKSTAEYDLVFDVKADGWFNMMTHLGDFPIGRIVVFSSIAGRFGNGGQTDYSAANDFLCKSMSNLKTTRPGTVGIALDWTAWDAIGMASRGSIPTVMKAAGIDMLPPDAGIGFLEKALESCGQTTEMVVAQSLGLMLEEFDPTGGVEIEKWNELAGKNGSLMVQRVENAGLYKGLIVSGEFDPKAQPFLYDHEINGTPVLPGVMGIEAMAEAARSLYPDWRVEEVFDVEFLSPFKFYRAEPRTVYVQSFLTAEGDDLIADCKLFGVRKLHGKEEEEVTDHFYGKVRLTKRPEGEPVSLDIKPKAKKDGVAAAHIYELYFHGPAYQVLESAWTEGDRLVALMAKDLPANHIPESASLLALPRHIETCFQAAGLIEMGQHERMGLPAAVGRVRFYGTPNAKARLFAVVDKRDEAYDISIVDKNGVVFLSAESYKTSALPGNVDAEKNAALKAIFN
ncbi:MAG: SDR family NAD(P)-dependent oxidoreductase [Lewinellaceae bacterium]|nr:SDR family NAD(P)-dependent oxidoreductase [Lewinellaceae bacterium]